MTDWVGAKKRIYVFCMPEYAAVVIVAFGMWSAVAHGSTTAR